MRLSGHDSLKARRTLTVGGKSYDYFSLAVASASGISVAISTEGKSPGLAKRIREDLVTLLSDPRLARFVSLLQRKRLELPRGQRAKAMADAVTGFSLMGELRFPHWFDQRD